MEKIGIFYNQNDNPFPRKDRLVVTYESEFLGYGGYFNQYNLLTLKSYQLL